MDLNSLIDTDVYQRGTDIVLGKCRDMLVDIKDARLTYVYVETGSWLLPSHALFSAARLSVEGSGLVLDATLEEVKERTDTQAAEGEHAPDPSHMPPMVVGPFGYTVSPLMAASLVDAFRSRERDARPDAEGDSSTMRWFTHLQGLPVFDPWGALGDVSDIVVNPQDMRCISLRTVDKGKNGLFDFHRIRRITQDDQSIILKSHEPDSALAQALETLGSDAERS